MGRSRVPLAVMLTPRKEPSQSCALCPGERQSQRDHFTLRNMPVQVAFPERQPVHTAGARRNLGRRQPRFARQG